MKNPLHNQEKAFLYEKDGKVHPEEMCIDEIIAAVNRGIKGDWGTNSPEAIIIKKIHDWICRYIEEGATEKFLDKLNTDLRPMQYAHYVVPADFYSPNGDQPQSIYIANLNLSYSHEAHAAKEFSRLITNGMLNRINRCQMPDCEKIFIGPPQRKWCSTTCGSKYRVNRKRNKDKS